MSSSPPPPLLNQSTSSNAPSNITNISKRVEFPHITFADLSPEYKARLEQASRKKSWKRCAVCQKEDQDLESGKLKRCPNCGNDLQGLRVYYCSRKCQRLDWPKHRENCGEKESAYFLASLSSPYEDYQVARFINKMWPRWNVGLRPLTAWLLWQLANSGGHFDRENTFLVIHYETYPDFSSKSNHRRNTKDPQTSTDSDGKHEYKAKSLAPWASSFEVRPITELKVDYKAASRGTTAQAVVVHIYGGDSIVSVTNVDPKNLGPASYANLPYNPDSFFVTGSGPSVPSSSQPNRKRKRGGDGATDSGEPEPSPPALWRCPQWPWIYSTMSLLGETSALNAHMKLHHFLTLMRPILVPEMKPSESFQEPGTQDGQTNPEETQAKGGGDPLAPKFQVEPFPDLKKRFTRITLDKDDFREWQSLVGSIIDY